MDYFIQVIYYGFVLVMHVYANYEMIRHPHLTRSWLVHFSYLTHLGFYLNYVYYFLRFACLFKGGRSVLREVEDKVRGVFQFQFAVSFVIAVSFWGMYFTDPLLLETRDIKIPMYCNITIHGLNFVFNLIEHAYMRPGSTFDPIPREWYFIITAIYSTYAYSLYVFKDIVLYNFVTTNWPTRIAMVVSSFVLLLCADWVYLNMHRLKHKAKL